MGDSKRKRRTLCIFMCSYLAHILVFFSECLHNFLLAQPPEEMAVHPAGSSADKHSARPL